MSAKLLAEEGTLAGLSLSFDEGTEWIIGRNPEEAQLVVEDPMVSRRHCRCYVENEEYFLENLSETNPVLVNGDPVEEPYRLRPGDTLLLGEQTFRFYQETTAHIVDEEPVPEEEEEPKETTHHDTVFEEEKEAPPKVEMAFPEMGLHLQEAGRYLLKVIGGPNNGAEFFMEPGREYVLGTDSQVCDIVFQDTSVSRRHAKIVLQEDHTCTIEDLQSSNGTLIEGRKTKGTEPLPLNGIIALGTTLIVIYDREAEMQTVISPLLPSIVKMLQSEHEEDEKKAEKEEGEGKEIAPPQKKQTAVGTLLLIGALTGLFVIATIGVVNLFSRVETVQVAQIQNPKERIQEVFNNYPTVSFTYSEATGTLLLIGHVLTDTDRNQLLFELQSLPFIKRVDDQGLVIDEFVWREVNQLLANNSKWKGVSISTPSPGKFVMTGYITNRNDAENLLNYLSVNFPYLDLLERKLIIEQDVIQKINLEFQKVGIDGVQVQMANGDISFTGTIPSNQLAAFDKIVKDTENQEGIRNVHSYVAESRPQKGVINITDEYEVGGRTQLSGGRISVVVNGKFVSVGGVLDGRTVLQITSNRIVLQDNEGKLYQIDY